MAKKGAVRVSITGDSSDLRRELIKSEKGIQRFADKGTKGFKAVGSAAGHVDSRLGKVARAAAGVGAGYIAIAEAKEAINTTVELGKATIGLSRNLGLSTQRASEWAAVAKVRGIETKALNMAFGTLAKNEVKAAEGAETQAASFRKLGISQRELRQDDFNTILGKSADGLRNMAPGAERTAVAMQLFGRGWQTVVPVLRSGSRAMEEQLGLARKYGATFGGKTIKSVEDLIQAQREMKFATLGLQIAFGTALAPALAKILPHIGKFINQLRTGKGDGGQFRVVIAELVEVVKTATPAVLGLLRVFASLAPALKLLRFTMGGLIREGMIRLIAIAPKLGDVFKSAWRTVTQATKAAARVFGDMLSTLIRGFAKTFELASKLPVVGSRFKGVAEMANRAADKVDRIGEKASRTKEKLSLLTSKTWPVNVSLKVGASSGIPGFKPLVPLDSLGSGDPLGVDKNIARAIAQVGSNVGKANQGPYAQFIQSQMGGGLGGGIQTGTYGKANRVAQMFGLRISSAYRSPQHNAAVGGVPNSLHTHGTPENPGAIDLVGATGSMYQALGWATSHLNLNEAMVHDVGSGLHLHLGFFEKGGLAQMKQMAVVGEAGPELVSLPAGARVHSHTDSKSMVARMKGIVPGFKNGGTIPQAGSRGGEYHRLIRMASAKTGVPPHILAGLIDIESKWNPAAVSSAGAKGMTQFMPGTASSYGVRYGTDHTAVATQIMGAAAYLIDLGWNSDQRRALGAYNGGPGNPQYGYADDVLAASGQYRGLFGGRSAGKRPTKNKKPKLTPRQKRAAQKRKDNISRGAFAGRLRGQGHTPWTMAFGDQMANALALAELTPGTGDDRAANVQALQGWLGFLQTGRATGNQALTTEAAQNVKTAIDAIKSIDETTGGGGGTNPLADALTDLVEQTKENNALLKERNAYAGSIANTSKEVAIKALADVISGQIGGMTTQRRRSAGDGVTVARY